MTDAQRRRLLRDAREWLSHMPVDWSQLDDPRIEFYHDHDDIVLAIIWPAKTWPNRDMLVLTNVWWDEDTGEILQAGSNYERLAY